MDQKYLTTAVGINHDVWQLFKLLWAEVLYKPKTLLLVMEYSKTYNL